MVSAVASLKKALTLDIVIKPAGQPGPAADGERRDRIGGGDGGAQGDPGGQAHARHEQALDPSDQGGGQDQPDGQADQ